MEINESPCEPLKEPNQIFCLNSRSEVVRATGGSTDEMEPVIAQLLLFRERFNKLPVSFLCHVFIHSLSSTFSIFSGLVGSSILSVCTYYSMNKLGVVLHQACFGMVNAYYYTFCFSLVLSSLDKIGIGLSKAYGEGDYWSFRQVKTQGLMSIGLLSGVISVPMFLFSGSILRSMGVLEENAKLCEETLLLLMGAMFLQVCSDVTRTVCISQGLERHFARAGAVNIVVCFISTYILVFSCGLSIYGWIICRYMYELTNLSVGLYAYSHTHPETRGFTSLRESAIGLWSFFLDNLNYTLTSYCEFFSYQATVFFVALTHDNNQMASLASIFSCASIPYCFGYSLSAICRTRVNMLIGSERFLTARNYFEYFYFCSVVMGAAMSMFLVLIREPLSWIYADSNPQMKEWFKLLIIVYSFGFPNEASICVVMIGMKSLNKLKLLIKICFATVVFGAFLAGLAIHKFNGQVHHYVASMIFFFFTLNVACYFIAVKSDWTMLHLPATKICQEAKELQAIDSLGDKRNNLEI